MSSVRNVKFNKSRLTGMLFLLSGALLVLALLFSALHFIVGEGASEANIPPLGSGDNNPAVVSTTDPASTSEPLVASTKFYSGISIGGYSVAGQTKEQAKTIVEDMFKQNSRSVILQYGDNYYELSDGEQIAIRTNIDEVIEEAYALGRTGNTTNDKAVIEDLKLNPVDFDLTFSVEFLDVQAIADEINSAIGTAPVNAGVDSFDKATGFTFTAETPGYQVDEVALEAAIKDAVETNNLYPVEIKMVEVAPEVTSAQLQEQYTLMAEFSTIAKKDSARNANITLALAQFDGMVVAPGEKVSFNGTTGERTEAKGYKVAGVIMNGVSSEDVGGGICQASGTLFNAVIRAGLEINTRVPHSWPSDYIGEGMDAMVDWPSADFVFTNSSKSDIYIAAWFESDIRKLVVQIYGVPVYDPAITVELRAEKYEDIPQPEDRYTFSEAMYSDEIVIERNGRAGSKWNTYLQFFDADGNLIEEKLAYTSTYRAIATKIITGTMTRGSGLNYEIIDGKIVFNDPSVLGD